MRIKMKYKNLGKAGIKLSELSFGSWITFGNTLDLAQVKKCLERAFDLGINFFDNAEGYGRGEAENLMGQALKNFRREDLVISTKIFWGGNGPNDTGLSWKHLVEGTRNSLRRLKMNYVDLIFCHRPDPSTPIEETVRAMDFIIKSGYAFYWGTSQWTAEQIFTAYELAEKFNCVPPAMEQPIYNLLSRDKVEREFVPVLKKHQMGLTTWSPLASGILSGKYNNGIPKGSRLDTNEWLRQELTPSNIEKVKKLAEIAKNLECTLAQLSIAWCLLNPNVSTVITGASCVEQIEENIKSIEIKDRITETVKKEIEKII